MFCKDGGFSISVRLWYVVVWDPVFTEHMTNVVIQQNNRKLLMMDILMSETCWAHKKWNKNTKWQQVGLLFSTITMMQGPTNVRPTHLFKGQWRSLKFPSLAE